jgi:methionyl-tRNA synthetase
MQDSKKIRKRCSFYLWFDEHGIPITIRAKKEGVTPQDIVDKYHESLKNLFRFGNFF